MNKLKWCFKKGGAEVVLENELLSKSYFKNARSSFTRAKENFEKEDYLWATVVIYYSEYYALYSFLQRIGIKCENHDCSIEIVEFLIGEEYTKSIKIHKKFRIDAQYYMKVGQKELIEKMIIESRDLIQKLNILLLSLDKNKINSYKLKLMEVLDKK
jgi:uncharacterized protein (UPF0332 family)